MKLRPEALAVACALVAGAVLAQVPMYRSTMPDGKKVVSDRPMPGATKVEEIKPSAGNYAPGDSAARSRSPGSDSGRGEAIARAEQELDVARKAHEAALARQAKAREETEGDRIGTYKGGARLSDAYEKRQAAAQAEVDAASKNVEAAQRKLRDAR